jgi:hypothetical protein
MVSDFALNSDMVVKEFFSFKGPASVMASLLWRSNIVCPSAHAPLHESPHPRMGCGVMCKAVMSWLVLAGFGLFYFRLGC